jgi:hypothetical protein
MRGRLQFLFQQAHKREAATELPLRAATEN